MSFFIKHSDCICSGVIVKFEICHYWHIRVIALTFMFNTVFQSHDLSYHPQGPSQSTPSGPPTRPQERARSWTWMTTFIWEAFLRTRPAWCSPPKCGRLCWTTASWAACGTCSSMVRARTCGAWLRRRRPQGSNPPAPKKHPSSASATPVWTTGSAGRAGTATCVTALELASWDGPVKEVGVVVFLFFFLFFTLNWVN